MERRYLVRTYGCQMNEHDSERIAGVLEADGMVPTDEVGDAQVIVLNTCAVRENADNRLYGNLGHLRPVKDANPEVRIVALDSIDRARTVFVWGPAPKPGSGGGKARRAADQ